MALVRFSHKVIGDGRYHVITSPDLKGLHVTAETLDEAEREALAVVALIMQERAGGSAQRLAGVAFEAA